MNKIEIIGEEVETFLLNEKTNHENEVYDLLSRFNSFDLFFKLHRLIHTIEEFINIFKFGLDKNSDFDEFLMQNISMANIAFNLQFETTWDIIEKRYGKNTKERLVKLVVLSTAQKESFKICGLNLGDGIHLNTIEGIINYYQSRRRYFTSLLYLLPSIKSGTYKLDENEVLNELSAIVELQSIPLTNIYQNLIKRQIFNDFKIIIDGNIYYSNYQYNALDEMYMEPERISIVEQWAHREKQIDIPELIKLDKSKIFSVNELKNSILLIASSYSLYELTNSKWNIYKEIILKLLEFIKEDYFISIKINQFDNIVKDIARERFVEIFNNLISSSKSYSECVDSYHPFIKFEARYYSNANLLMRFLYYYKNIVLNKNKKFQIHSGFVFEDQIKEKLSKYGFLITDIKRINKKEFDVVTVKNNIIYNFQCKNSFIDISLINKNQKMFIRHNKRFVNYFKKALIKEEKRETLLTNKLDIDNIKHFVISRFPIICDDKRIISFSSIDNWIENNILNKDFNNEPI